MGEAWLLWMLALGGSGFAIGSSVAFTMPCAVRLRLVAGFLVLAAVVFAVGLNVVGLVPASFGLMGVFLWPVLTAAGLRHRWAGTTHVQPRERD